MKEMVVANTLAVLAAAYYVICALWVVVARDSYLAVMGSLFHGIDMKSLPPAVPDTSGFILGLVSIVVLAWVSGYAFVIVYKKLSK